MGTESGVISQLTMGGEGGGRDHVRTPGLSLILNQGKKQRRQEEAVVSDSVAALLVEGDAWSPQGCRTTARSPAM